jgi:hypothetical protein
MTISLRLAALLAFLIVPLAMSSADATGVRPGAYRRCPLTLPQQTSTGTLSNGQTSTVIQMSVTCTGFLTASASGGTIILQTANGSKWDTVKQGSSITTSALGPGSYRLIVQNIGQIRVNYKVRFRYAFG